MNDIKIHTCIIVDDSEQDVFLTGRLFKKAKVDLQICHYTSTQAIVEASLIMNEHQVAGSIVFLDRYLGTENGIELVKLLRLQTPLRGAIIGICSGSDNLAEKQEANEAGASFFVDKPLDINALISVCEVVPNLALLSAGEDLVALTRVNLTSE